MTKNEAYFPTVGMLSKHALIFHASQFVRTANLYVAGILFSFMILYIRKTTLLFRTDSDLYNPLAFIIPKNNFIKKRHLYSVIGRSTNKLPKYR